MDLTIALCCTTTFEDAVASLVPLSQLAPEPTFDLVVVDDAVPGVRGLVQLLDGNVTAVLHTAPAGLAAVVRNAVARAESDVVALLLSGAVVLDGWHRRLSAALSEPGVSAVVSLPEDLPASLQHSALAATAVVARRDELLAVDVAGVPDALVLPFMVQALERAGRVVVDTVGLRRAPAQAPTSRGSFEPGTPVELTIVVPTLDATSERARRCLAAIQACTEAPHEVVVVDNGAPAQGFSRPVNAGLRAADSPFIVVCNDDVEVLPGWWPPLRAALETGAEVVFPATEGGVTRPDFSAWCFALRAGSRDRLGWAPGRFFREDLVLWYQDTDLLVRLREQGAPPALVPDSRVRHGLSKSVRTSDPRLSRWISNQVRLDRDRFEGLHGAAVPGAAVWG